MSRLIDRDTLKKSIIDAGQSSRRYKLGEVWELNGAEIEEVIDAQLPIEERKTGKPVVKSTGYRGYWACDQCGTEIKSTDNFCRHCGADLRGKQE